MQKSLPPYAYIAYEPDDAFDSTGMVLYYADSISELARRTKMDRHTIASIIRAKRLGTPYEQRVPYNIEQVALN